MERLVTWGAGRRREAASSAGSSPAASATTAWEWQRASELHTLPLNYPWLYLNTHTSSCFIYVKTNNARHIILSRVLEETEDYSSNGT